MESFLIKYGLLAVFFGSAVEADAMPVLSGAFSHFGYFGYPFALVACVGGMFTGDCIWYWTGRIFGNQIRETKLFKKRFPQVEKYIDRIGILQVLFSRVFYGTRNATMLIWGVKKYSFLRFAWVDLLGCAIWGTLLVSLGYFLSLSVKSVVGDIKDVEIFFLIIAVCLILFIILRSILSRSWKNLANEK
jgi:membrane protein DedA with SNARE-associated domain